MPERERPQEEGDRQREIRENSQRWIRYLTGIFNGGEVPETQPDPCDAPEQEPDPQAERARPYEFTPGFMREEYERQAEQQRRRMEMMLNNEALQDARRMQQQQMQQAQPQTATQQWFGGATGTTYRQMYDALYMPMGGSSPLWQTITQSTSTAGDGVFEYRAPDYPVDPNYIPDVQLDHVENVKLEPKRRNLPR